MLRYRVAYDSERGHFVLPTLASIVPPDETFASRSAAEKIAQARNSRDPMSTAVPNTDSAGNPLHQEAALRRASA